MGKFAYLSKTRNESMQEKILTKEQIVEITKNRNDIDAYDVNEHKFKSMLTHKGDINDVGICKEVLDT